MRIYACTPLAGRDVGHVRGWAEAVRRAIAAAGADEATLACGITRGDVVARQAAEIMGAEAHEVEAPHQVEPARGEGKGRRKNFAGSAPAVALKRLRLAQKAAEGRYDIVWFVDADIRPHPQSWKALRREITMRGTAIAFTPYPVWWAGGIPAVAVAAVDASDVSRTYAADISGAVNVAGAADIFDSVESVDVIDYDVSDAFDESNAAGGAAGKGAPRLALVDARKIAVEPGTESFPAIAGGFGCAAAPLWVFGVTRIEIRGVDVTGRGDWIVGEDVGWYFSALKQGLRVRCLGGHEAEHLECPAA